MRKELWLIWKEPNTRRRYTVGTLIQDIDGYTFKYFQDTVKSIEKLGFDFFPGFEETEKIYHSNKLFTSILNRLPNPIRTDYETILKSYGLSRNSSEVEILEITKGRLLTDNYEFVPAFNKNKIEFDLAGTRHCQDFEKCRDILKIGDKLILELEDKNKYDENAIVVLFDEEKRYKIGYVPRYYSKPLAELLKEDVTYSAKVINIKIESLIKDEIISGKVELFFKNK
ncbi:MAG: HIRAN domain-containing protein [Clostridia bacterium]